MKKSLAMILSALLLLSLLAGCSARNETTAAGDKYYGYLSDDSMSNMSNMEIATDSLAPETPSAEQLQNRKLIRTVYLEAETEDMASLLQALEAQISALGGYTEAKHVYNGSRDTLRSYRYADLTVRIPVDSADGFVQKVSDGANITSSREESDEVTLT